MIYRASIPSLFKSNPTTKSSSTFSNHTYIHLYFKLVIKGLEHFMNSSPIYLKNENKKKKIIIYVKT
jgi:hypothetical protein